MESKNYVYTLPQQFIEDPSVPLHWKLYTIVNGFWISGKPVFASNEWFAKELKCTERNVQLCFSKLEKMCLLERVGKSQKRSVIPFRGRTDSSCRDEVGVRGRDEATVRHTSDSNTSDNLLTPPEVPEDMMMKFSSDVYRMVDLLVELIVKNNPDWQMRGSRETWASHIDKLHRIDNRTFEQIEYMIRWTQHDSFWSQNILSTSKLREKFNDLIPKLKASMVKNQKDQKEATRPKMMI